MKRDTKCFLQEIDFMLKEANNLNYTESPNSSSSDGVHLLNQCFETYMDSLKRKINTTRIGNLLLKERAITQAQLREALQIQKGEPRFLGEILIKMGVVGQKKLAQALSLQSRLRSQLASKFVQERLRLGQILTHTQTITQDQLRKALERQKQTKELLGKILVEMKAISQSTLQEFLKIQKELKRIIAVASLALLLVGCATGTGTGMRYDYHGRPVLTTPFDSRYKRVKKYLRTAYQFKYQRDPKGTDYWQLPEETERRGKGDCEDKAIWLYTKLLSEGFHNIRLIIGKRREDSRMLHAWVAWYQKEKVYILDPTFQSQIWEIQQYPKGYYKPYYSFYREKSWNHLTSHNPKSSMPYPR